MSKLMLTRLLARALTSLGEDAQLYQAYDWAQNSADQQAIADLVREFGNTERVRDALTKVSKRNEEERKPLSPPVPPSERHKSARDGWNEVNAGESSYDDDFNRYN